MNEKPATVRIESNLRHGLDVGIRGPGNSILGYERIPAATADGAGVLETDKLDAITLRRLRWHYEWRPTDPKNAAMKKEDLQPSQIQEIGLLQITVMPAGTKPKGTKPESTGDQSEGKGGGASKPSTTKAA